MITSNNGFTQLEKVSLSDEIKLIGVQSTPFTSLLLSKGVEKATSTIHSWREYTLDDTENITVAEGSETTDFQQSSKRELHNVLEIFKKAVSISGTAQAMKNTEFSEEVSRRLLELKINLEKKLINGLKDDGSTSGIRKMSGLIEFADTNNAVSGKDVEKLIKDGMRKLWDNDLQEGNYYAFVNADVKEAIDEVYKDRYSYQHQTTNFGLVVDTINTNYGIVNVVLSKHVPDNQIVLFNDAYLKLIALREAQFEPLAKTGDSTKGQIIGEYTLKVASPLAVATMTIE